MTTPNQDIAFIRKHLRIPVLATRETSRNANKKAAAPQILSKDFGIQPKNWRRMQPRINSQTRNRMLADGLKLFGNN
jgi:hypothetical protein